MAAKVLMGAGIAGQPGWARSGLVAWLPLAVGFSMCLTGCVTHYVAPSNLPVAKVTLAADLTGQSGPMILVQNFADESCKPNPLGNRLATFTTRKIQGKGDPHDGITLDIPADKPFIFTYHYFYGAAPYTDTVDCTVTQSFVPVEGGSYKAKFRITDKMCFVLVTNADGTKLDESAKLHKIEPACINAISG